MIIDSHTHIFPDGWTGRRESLCSRDALFAELYGNPAATMATASDLVAAMDGAGIDRAVVCGFAWADPALCREHNDALLAASARYPGRLLPFAAVSLTDPAQARVEVARCRALGAVGVGELRPEAHGLDLTTAHDAGALAEVAGGLPLLLHASEPAGHPYPGKAGQSIGPLYQFLARHPEVVVIAAHLGGGLPLFAHMPEVRRALANVSVDLAAWTLLYRPSIIPAIIDLIGADRILFATDFPLRPYERELAAFQRLPLSPDHRARILGLNAARLFGIDAAETRALTS